jgi:cytochrome c
VTIARGRIVAAAVRLVLLIAVALALSLVWAPGAETAPDDPRAIERGGTILRRNCAMCHAVGRHDRGPSPTAPAFRDLHERYAVESLAEALAEGIITGHPAMPEFRFAPDEVNAIIAYLRSLKSKRQAGSAPP